MDSMSLTRAGICSFTRAGMRYFTRAGIMYMYTIREHIMRA